MNKFIASAGLVVLGAASLTSAQAQGLTRLETAKPWSVSASLRGFYDDNYTAAPRDVRRDSFGFEVSPSFSLNIPLEQSFIGFSYVYSMRWFEDREQNSADHTHQINAKFDHAFTERYKIELDNSFVIAQEPTLFATDGFVVTPLRTEGDNIRNRASARFTAQLTHLLGLQLGYSNLFVDYEQEGPGSRSALLDRMEHLGNIDLRWQVLPQTVGIVGYQFGITRYTADEPLSEFFLGDEFFSDDRNSRSHYVYAGVDQTFTPQLRGSARVGAQYVDYYRMDDDSVSPYADASLTYTYLPGSYVSAGVKHMRRPTDVFALDQEATSVYASVTHKLTANLTGSLLGQYQRSTFEVPGDFADATDGTENFFIVGLNLAYRFNQHWMAETGYNYDKLNSDFANRGYTRNRVYAGVRATF